MAPNPTWYDILGVDRDATPAQIKAAWRAATDKFEPGSGTSQFRLFNEAADVLLDPERRAEYDASLGAPSDAGAPTTAAPAGAAAASGATGAATDADPQSTTEPTTEPSTEPAGSVKPGLRDRLRRRRADDAGRPEGADTAAPAEDDAGTGLGRAWLLPAVAAATALALVAVLVAVGLLWKRSSDAGIDVVEGTLHGETTAREDAADSARAAAQRGLTAVLSYDYRRLEADKERALRYLTPSFGEKFGQTFDKLLTAAEKGQPNNVVKTKTVVKADVLDDGVMNPGAATTDRVRVLAFVNQSSRKGDRSPTVFQNRVAVTMVERDGRWLIDDLTSY